MPSCARSVRSPSTSCGRSWARTRAWRRARPLPRRRPPPSR
jgi:hypothetical protein